jgi:DNA-binding NtrC family response regulator
VLEGRRIVLIEDDDIMGGSLVQRLELEGAEVLWFKQMTRALGALRTPRAPIDAAVCDIRLPDGSGEELFLSLLRTASPPPFLFITGHGGVDQAVRLMHAGAADYVTKPFEMSVFLGRLSLLVAATDDSDTAPLIGVSQVAKRAEALALAAAKSGAPVLIRGGTGTGKGLVARFIHSHSDRSAAPFVDINIARVDDLSVEVFGPEGGLARVGEGTLFVQALDHLPLPLQTRLLAALNDGFTGRVIASCGYEADRLAGEGALLPDLLYFLDQVDIAVPPLAERGEDAVWLAHQLVNRLTRDRPAPHPGLSTLAEQALSGHDWPGGGRELRSRLIRALDTATGEHLQPADLFPERMAKGRAIPTLAEARGAAERRQIIAALEHTGGQVSQAAKLLSVSRTTLWEKMQKLGLSERSGESGQA